MLIWNPDVGWGQCTNDQNCIELITSNDLELDPIVAPNPMSPPSNGFQTFQLGYVAGWHSSHNTPHHFKYLPGVLCESSWTTWNNVIPCIGANQFQNEGIYTDLPLTEDPFVWYCLNLNVQKMTCGDDQNLDFIVSLTSGLDPFPPNTPIKPDPTNAEQILRTEFLNNYSLRQVSESFQVMPGSGYNQLWLHTKYKGIIGPQYLGGVATANSIHLTCRTTALTAITTNVNCGTVNFGTVNASTMSFFESFRWDFGDPSSGAANTSTLPNPTHVYTQNGTYDVCVNVIDNNGCCARRCTQVTISNLANFNIQTNQISPCNFNFSAIGIVNNQLGVTYSWNFGDGTTGSGKFVNHTYTSSGTYTVSCTVTNNCGSITQFVVVNLPVLNAGFTVQNNCPSYTFMVTNPMLNATYTWSTPGGTPTGGTGTTFTTNYAANGPYMVSLNVVDICGQTISSSLQVNVNCNGCQNIPGIISVGVDGHVTPISTLLNNGTIPFTLSGGTLRKISNQTLSFSGTIIIDVPTQIANTHIFCEAGSEISLGATFMITGGSILEGCNTMWKGIKNHGGYSLSSTNSFINDALFAVDIIGTGSKLNIRSTVFQNNFIGIRCFNDPFKLKAIYLSDNTIKDNTFTSDGNFKDMYDGQPVNTDRPYCGISLTNVESFKVTGGRFENLQLGIEADKTDLVVTNVHFENNNTGISLSSLRGKNKVHSNCRFINNINKGIEISNSTMGEVTIESNTFSSGNFTMTGVLVAFCYGTKIFIKNKNVFNKAYYNYSAISISECYPAELEIIDNDFLESNLFFQNIVPIKRPLIKDNRIKMGNYSMMEGININRFDFISNEFTASPHATAFVMEGISQCWFNDNSLIKQGRAFSIEMSPDNAYCANNMTEGHVTFTGTCTGTSFSNNNLQSLSLHDEGVIGPQIDACNTWINSEGYESSGSIFPGQNSTTPPEDLATASRFIYDKNAAGGRPVNIYPPSLEDVWFRNTGAQCTEPLLNCGGSPYPLLPPGYGIPGSDTTISPGDSSIIISDPPRVRKCKHLLAAIQALNALNTSLYASTIEQSNWNLQLMLNRAIDTYGVEFWKDCLDELFVLDIDISRWFEAEKDKENVKQPSKQRLTEYNAKVAEIDVLNDQIASLTLNSNEITDPVIPSVIKELSIAQNELAAIVDFIKSESLTKAENFLKNIHALPLRYPFLAHRKVVWAVDMKIFIQGLNSITVQEWDQIRTIANMCPLDVGQAVYEARGLMGLINEFDFESIETSCVKTKIRSISTDVIPSVTIYPNPSDGVFHIQSTTEEVDIHIMIYDAMGKLVMEREVSHNHTVDLSGREPGVYYYKCVMGDKTESRGKLILIK